MRIKFSGTYVKVNDITKTTKDMFRYTVEGTSEELAAYKESCGANYREDVQTGTPLFFSQDYVGETQELAISQNSHRAYADTSELKKAASLAKQFGGNLGQAIAAEAAKNLMSGMRGSKAAVAVAAPAPVVEPVEPKLGEL